uniref:tRNA pseudouridine synthase 1 (Trinotate prediction) n=1 Tax=Myxobolus squamalis TaxID=59785 RepID=A0A6B2G6B9_MYXSQ
MSEAKTEMDKINNFPDETETKNLSTEPKINYKMVALLVGYLGHNYHGVQIQTGQNVSTIERDLFKALANSEAVRKENCFDAKKMNFQRCSRTDKHVSAVRQIFSLKA